MKFLTLFFCLTSLSVSAARSKEERKELFNSATNKLKEDKVGQTAPKVGEKFPEIKLNGEAISKILKYGPVVITFYRGGWCPYCVAQLKRLNEKMSELKASKAQLIAISPETEMEVRKTKNKNKLNFTLIHDEKNALARQLDLVFKVDAEVVKEYLALGIDLQKSQGNTSYELPVPATFVIAQDGTVQYSFVEVDYTQRANEDDIIRSVKAL